MKALKKLFVYYLIFPVVHTSRQSTPYKCQPGTKSSDRREMIKQLESEVESLKVEISSLQQLINVRITTKRSHKELTHVQCSRKTGEMNDKLRLLQSIMQKKLNALQALKEK